MENAQNRLVFFVNSRRVEDASTDPRMSLASYLRQKMHLTGTKIGCNQGGCGACTVMISEIDRSNGGKIRHFSVNACLTPIARIHGRHVTTVEGVGSIRRKLHPIQERLSKGHGSQCGFCTPGFIMAMYALLRENPNPSTEEVEECMQGNLCRCTGYRPILEAYYSFCAMGNDCCKNKANGTCPDGDKHKLEDFSSVQPYDPTQEPIFPPELQSHQYDREALDLKLDGFHWYRPTTLTDLLYLKSKHPGAKFVQGYSKLYFDIKFGSSEQLTLIDSTGINELKEIKVTDHALILGSCVTISQLQRFLIEFIPSLPEEKTRMLKVLLNSLHYFAGKHVRNVATWAGNLMACSPVSDLSPLFMAAGEVRIWVESAGKGERYIEIDDHFFMGDRKTAVDPDEFVKQLELPLTNQNEHFFGFKQAQRREHDTAIVNAGMFVRFEHGTRKVEKIRLSFGGMAATTIMAKKTMEQLAGRLWDDDLLNTGLRFLADDVSLKAAAPGGMERYRQTLCLSFFFKFYHNVIRALNGGPPTKDKLKPDGPMQATQIFRDIRRGSASYEDPIGRPIMHLSGEKHATGEAIYCDDVPAEGALHMAFLLSQKAHAIIKKIDFSRALAIDGVVDVVTHRDIPETGTNIYSQDDQFVFARDEVLFCGQIIAGVVAIDPDTARKAARLVKVEYEDRPIVLTIKDAIENDSYLCDPLRLVRPGSKLTGSDCDRVIEGEVTMGGQEHFYLEPHACIATPGEDDEMEIISATQSIADMQMEAAKVLGIPANKVLCKVKRVGGGFGGKESAGLIIALPTVVAANKLRKPVRVCLERSEDMTMTGTRHPFLSRYKVGLDKDGKFQAFEIEMFCNCGYSFDASWHVMSRAMLTADNVYRFPNFSAVGQLCKTNWMSATAFRGAGGPQGLFMNENCVVDAAYTLGIEPEKLREMNMYEEGDVTPYGQTLEQCNARRCWNECAEMSNFWTRREEVNDWNRKNRWIKRGIAMIPNKFGCAFGVMFMNQGASLVHIYRDGSVLVSHAGIEIGQGLHTKMVQIASRTLEIPMSKITIKNTATDRVPNGTATAGSMGSDLNGMAVMEACQTLKRRLEPIIAADPKGSWESWINKAYLERISLSATGFYKSDFKGFDFDKGEGEPYNYFVYGVACTEVEIDCLTGDHRILRTNIVMDIGDSLNPAVDIGQIEGAFTQGYGLFTMEELKVSPAGVVLTRGPGTYKIPTAADVPRVFNVKLLKGSSNKKAIFSSKAVGEPPLCLGVSVFFAIKDAIKASREDYGLTGHFRLDSPASAERIRLACRDPLSDMIQEPQFGTNPAWTVTL